MRCSPHHLSNRSRLLFFYLIYIFYTLLKFSFAKHLPFVKILKYYSGAVLYNSVLNFFLKLIGKFVFQMCLICYLSFYVFVCTRQFALQLPCQTSLNSSLLTELVKEYYIDRIPARLSM